MEKITITQDQIDKLKADILEILMKQAGDLWKEFREEELEFLKRLAEDIATQKLLASQAVDPVEFNKNLEHLSVTVKGEIVRYKLKIGKKSIETLQKIVATVISLLIKVAIA